MNALPTSIMDEIIKLHAWKGDEYETTGIDGLRILLLGDSSYSPDGRSQSPEDLVRMGYLNPAERRSWHRTYTKAIQAVLNCKVARTDRAKAWRKVAFWNLLLGAAGAKPRDHSGVRGKVGLEVLEALYAVLDDLVPDGIVVWGDNVWNHLPTLDIEPNAGCDIITKVITTPHGITALACLMTHPSSSRFRNDTEWSKLSKFRALLAEQKRPRKPGSNPGT